MSALDSSWMLEGVLLSTVTSHGRSSLPSGYTTLSQGGRTVPYHEKSSAMVAQTLVSPLRLTAIAHFCSWKER